MWVKEKQLAFILVAILVSAGRAHAGAWTQEPGHGQIIFTASFYETSNAFDENGGILPFAGQGQFRQLLFSPYFELGIAPRITLVGTVNAPVLRYSDTSGVSNSAGMGDIELGIKRRLNSVESAWAISGQVSVMFPAYSATENPAPGNHQEDVEARMLLGRGTSGMDLHAFWDAEIAYRYRSGAPADQFRADMTGGTDVTKHLTVLAQLFSIKSLRNGEAFNATNPNAQSDFDLYKAELSLVVKVARGIKIQAGWSDAFAGRNTGSGSAAILALWKTF